jgi:hypothetical protein
MLHHVALVRTDVSEQQSIFFCLLIFCNTGLSHPFLDHPIGLFPLNIYSNTLLTEVMGGWRKLHNRELHDVCGACGVNGEEESVSYWYERQGKIPQGRPSCRWVDNIKMDLEEI